jgi:hypothetical protein
MMRLSRAIVCGLATVLSGATPALAQTWTERVHISVNGAFQATTNDFSDRFEFERNLETGFTEADYRVESGFVFDAGGGYRLWKNLGAGASVSYFTRSGTAATTSSFPHPFFFSQPREVTGDATDLARTETAVHVQAMYLLNPGGKLRAIFSGGPSFFTVEQELVTEVQISETFPFDTATFASARTQQEKGSAVAFNVGADVLWMFTSKLGAGGLVRFSRATVDLDAPGNRTITIDAGGLQVGGGVRVLF